MNEKLVSIITPVYNSEETLPKTIESVLAQTYKHWELILIDDLSSDGSAKIIKDYSNKYSQIRVVSLEENGGVANARNKGIEVSRGSYIAFLDSDDLWDAKKLEIQINFMESNKSVFTYTSYSLIDSNDTKMGIVKKTKGNLTYKDLLKGNDIGCLTVVLKKDLLLDNKFEKIGHEDYLLWLEIMKKEISAQEIPVILAFYRRSNNSLSSDKWKSAKWTWRILRNKQNLNRIKAAYYFSFYIIKHIKNTRLLFK